MSKMGGMIAALHDAGITHGDLTTSNFICRMAANDHPNDVDQLVRRSSRIRVQAELAPPRRLSLILDWEDCAPMPKTKRLICTSSKERLYRRT